VDAHVGVGLEHRDLEVEHLRVSGPDDRAVVIEVDHRGEDLLHLTGGLQSGQRIGGALRERAQVPVSGCGGGAARSPIDPRVWAWVRFVYDLLHAVLRPASGLRSPLRGA